MHEVIVPILGISVVVTFSTLLLLWELRCRRHIRALDGLQPRIIVTGTRGKSSTVRLIHAALRADERRPWGRVTGTVTEEISPENRQFLLDRSGQTSIIEFLATVHRARVAGSDCLITESMAVKPELIDLTQRTFVRGDICVITNIRVDHMEDEGLDLLEIARSLSGIADAGCMVITSERDPELIALLRDQSMSAGARFVVTRGDRVDPRILAALPAEFPDNVAIALAIADELGIDPTTATQGMARATHEPFAVDPITHQFVVGRSTFTVASLGATNDPESARAELDAVEAVLGDSDRRIGVITSRWDRPLRSIEFAGFADPAEFDVILLAGPLYRVMRRNLARSGWDLTRVHPLRWADLRSRASLLRRFDHLGEERSRVSVITLANIDPPISQRFLALLEPFRIGDRTEFDGDLVDERGSATTPWLRRRALPRTGAAR